ncbi:MAG TPA: phosphatidate cytidylyltransferase, partial [Smithellaceae bacterium]|nr:phosphatidate cytidylyltransferase [Smithellaceae bacterium]
MFISRRWLTYCADIFSNFQSHKLYHVVLVSELYRKKNNPLHNWAYFIMGQVFIAMPFSLLPFIAYISGYQPLVLLAVFVTIWVNDTGAYLVGVTLGKHRLFERISPKKSWEGFFGGAVV